ncbi:MAG TPA: HAD-IB family hydrolase [Microscillaceae bacterium]|jgi:HAD superfamily hydrolase (TIGR01490 family)|nr:HAD-IB family hydrolase [Microscillaceae bacterium]
MSRSQHEKILALFDFDGTITKKDSFLVFIQYYVGSLKFWIGFLQLSPWVIAFKIGIINNHKFKEKVLKHFFKGQPVTDFKQKADYFSKYIIPTLIRPKALERLQMHKQSKYYICIVSASLEDYLSAWAKAEGFGLIATRLVKENNQITGRIAGKNCHGFAKVELIHQKYSLSGFVKIYAYGDTLSDLPMLFLAQDRHYKPFR